MTECNRKLLSFSRLGRQEIVADFDGGRLSSDAGGLLLREVDRHLGLTTGLAECIADPRDPGRITHNLRTLVAQRVFGIALGYEDLNDHATLRDDPLFAILGEQRVDPDAPLGSPSTLCRFENAITRGSLARMSEVFVDRFIASFKHPPKELILDFDPTDDRVHGKQEGRFFHGYYDSYCFLPLYVFCGDHLLCAYLRPSNIDAAFAIPGLYRVLEEEGFQYTIRIPSNDVLIASISHLLTRPVGRPSYKPKVFYESFSYQAQSWDRPRRVVAKVEWHWDELFPRVGFIVTNMTGWARTVVKFYNGRGTAEQWIKEGKYAVKWTRLSCRSFKDNQARLQLFALAYNLGNFLRRLALPRSVKHWSLTTLRETLIKIGAKIIRHSKYVTFQMAEVAVPRWLFAAILNRIQRFGVPPPLVRHG